jgi:hypothetical protein
MDMNISLASSRMNGFKKWSSDHPPSSNDDDNPGGATPIALVEPASDEPEDRPHRPWGIPGVGGSF